MLRNRTSPRRPGIVSATRNFFFASELPYGMAISRILLPITAVLNLSQRWHWSRELYSADGATSPLADNFGFFNMFPELPGTLCVALFTLMLCLLITSSIGWCTRFSLFAATTLYVYFTMLDCMSTLTKFTVITAHLLLLLGVSNCGAVWSVDAWLKARRRLPGHACGARAAELSCAVWPQRLVQLLLASIYFGSGITKIHTPAFFSGDQLSYWMMTHLNRDQFLGDILSQYPVLLVAFGYITVIWEISFTFCVWTRVCRTPVLLIGALFHVMTAFTLGLRTFPLVMICSYACFITEADVRWVSRWLRDTAPGFLRIREAWGELSSRLATALIPTTGWQWKTSGAFVLLLGAVGVGGVEAEYWADPYQMRGPGGPLPLRELADDEINYLLHNEEEPLRDKDKFQAFDLGTIVVGEHLLNRRREFDPSETIVAQVTMNPPHEDMWVECCLMEILPGADSSAPLERHELVHAENVTSEAMETEAGAEPTILENESEATDEGSSAVRLANHESQPRRVLPKERLVSRLGQVILRETTRSNFLYRLDNTVQPGEYALVLHTRGAEITRRHFKLLPPKNPAP